MKFIANHPHDFDNFFLYYVINATDCFFTLLNFLRHYREGISQKMNQIIYFSIFDWYGNDLMEKVNEEHKVAAAIAKNNKGYYRV